MYSASKDTVASVNDLHRTTDYGKFKILLGNRQLDKQHVKQLVKRMKENDLSQYFPILVNEKMEIIDGQHRVRALEELGYPVYYEIKEGLTIDSVISFNSSNKNWNWKDYAQSFADRGNKNYEMFLELFIEFGARFTTLMYYSTGSQEVGSGSKQHIFNDGLFVMKNYEQTHKMLAQYSDIAAEAGVNSREFSIATYRFMRMPYYDHDKMLSKIEAKGAKLNDCYFVNDFLDALEEIWKS